MANNELLTSWLKDAHSMEQAQKQTLERFSDQLEDFPDAKAKVEEHIKVTERQADDINLCLQRLGEDTSAVKSAVGTVVGAVQGMATAPFKDDIVKDMIAMHANEHFEHASYLSLAAAARECGEDEIAEACDKICEEELAMAEWIQEQIPVITASVIEKTAQDARP